MLKSNFNPTLTPRAKNLLGVNSYNDSHPEQTLKCFAELLGIEITKEIKEDPISLIKTPQEFLKALDENKEIIHLCR